MGLCPASLRVHPPGVGRWTGVVELGHACTLAALVGVVVVDPTARMRGAPDWSGWLDGHQRVDRVMSRVAPPLFLSATAAAAGAALVAAGRSQRRAAAGRGVATGCLAAAIAVTLTVNEPMNARIRGWRPWDAPADGWRQVRDRWEHGHRLRRALVATAAIASVWGGNGGPGVLRSWLGSAHAAG